MGRQPNPFYTPRLTGSALPTLNGVTSTGNKKRKLGFGSGHRKGHGARQASTSGHTNAQVKAATNGKKQG